MFLSYILIGLILFAGAYIFTGNGRFIVSIFMWALGWPIIVAMTAYNFYKHVKAHSNGE